MSDHEHAFDAMGICVCGALKPPPPPPADMTEVEYPDPLQNPNIQFMQFPAVPVFVAMICKTCANEMECKETAVGQDEQGQPVQVYLHHCGKCGRMQVAPERFPQQRWAPKQDGPRIQTGNFHPANRGPRGRRH